MATESVYKQTIFSADNNSEGVASYENSWTNTTDGFTVNIVNANNNNNGWNGTIKMGRKNVTSVGYIATAAAIDKAITKVDLTIDAVTASKINSLKLYRSTDGSTWTEESSFAVATGVKTATIAEANQAANLYYKIEADCQAGSSNGLIQFSKVEFYIDVAGAPETPTFSVEAGIFNHALSVELDCETPDATVYYTLDGTTPSDASTSYTAAISVTETTTIKAIAIKNGVSSGVASATYKIVETEGEGTKADPFTLADIVKFENQGDTAWVIGYILGGIDGSKPTIIDNTKPGIIALGATADATTFNPVQLISESATRAALNVVDNPTNIGKQVKVRGALEAYCGTNGIKGTNDYEFVDTPVPPTTYTVTVAAAVDGGTISASPLEAEEGDIITLTETPDAGWQFVEWIVKDADNNDVTVTNDQFTMPASNVTVNATFELIPVILKYAITVDNAIEGGSVSADKEEAAEGETVTLTATPDANYVFGAWNVKDADNADVTVTNNQFTMPAKAVTVSAVFQPVPPVGCDWDNLPFFNTGLPDTDENYNQFKICKEGEQPNVVNIQTAGWADNHKGIYASYPSAVFGTINIDAANYTIQGAGILFHLDAFTANETEVSVVCDNVEMVFTVLNTKAITPVVPIEITIDENVVVMDDLASTGGYWSVTAQDDDYLVYFGNSRDVTEIAGTYPVSELNPGSFIKTATDSISFVDGSITVEVLAGGIHFRGTIEGNDGEFYLLSISKALVGPTVVDVVAASPDDYVRWTDAVAAQGWWQIYGEGAEFGFSLSNTDTDDPVGTYGIDDLDPDWCYVVDLSNTADTITFSDGEIEVAIDAAGVVTVTGELLGSDGKTYAFDLTYKDPTAETTVNVTIAEGELDDTYLESVGLFGLAGIDATNNITAQFYIWTEEGMAGDYTEEDLDNYYFGSGIMVGTTVQEIFSATLHVTVDDNNQVVLTADVLCYNNTLYKVTLTVPGETPQPTYAVTFAQPQNGTLVVKNEGVAIASGDEFEAGVVLTVEATPADGFVLSTLTAGGVDIIDAKRFTIVDAAVEVVATFVADPTGINNVEGNQRRIKAIENGQLFINVNGVRYNVNGARVK